MMPKRLLSGVKPNRLCAAQSVDGGPNALKQSCPGWAVFAASENPESWLGARGSAIAASPKRDSVTTRGRQGRQRAEWRHRAWFSRAHRAISATLLLAGAGGHSTS